MQSRQKPPRQTHWAYTKFMSIVLYSSPLRIHVDLHHRPKPVRLSTSMKHVSCIDRMSSLLSMTCECCYK